ncbi:ribosome assembly protein 4 (RSA4) [Reticulomyxa filosa]|uniref:Ribosome assembly protein 4 (RSA4) n=1 Tax=Reticulomyxa filosa TaxID=46433 RepID=X6ML13_RETFI|nr:ribosome assembly protein 4 (RSA4) [Reticulomyxa filosa]|eukprot:ETO14539.1 ribosome assembly protein 4 (RSA4) [Reticulomyxa filosa]
MREKKFKFFFFTIHHHHLATFKKKNNKLEEMGNSLNKKVTSTQLPVVNLLSTPLSKEEEIKIIVQHWIRISNIKLGWINNFDKLVVNYAAILFIFDTFCLSSKLLKTFSGHSNNVWSIDYSTLDDMHLLCSGSGDRTVRVWDMETNRQIQLFNKHSESVFCVKFSSYHYYNHRLNVICSSSFDNTIRFWDFKNNQQLQLFNEQVGWIGGIEFSPFNGGRYLCSGSADNTIRLWDVETYKSLHIFDGHNGVIRRIAISPLQSNNNNNSNNIGVIGGNGYTICSGSSDKTIRIWDIETTKQLTLFKGHENCVYGVKYASNGLGTIGCSNTILSGSEDKSVRLWDIRSSKQIQVFNGHKGIVWAVEYSPFAVANSEIYFNSNVICSGSSDNTIRFWDIRSNKNQLYMIKGDNKEYGGILCLKFLQLKKNNNEFDCDINLCYGSLSGLIHIWG